MFCYSIEVKSVCKLDFGKMHLEYLLAFIEVRKSDVDLPVETTCTHKRLVKYVCTVCRGKNNHTAVGTEAIHFSKQLIQGVFPFVIA